MQKGRRKVLAELADHRIVVGLEAGRTVGADHIAEVDQTAGADRIAEAGHIAAVASAAAAFAVVADLSRGGRDPSLRAVMEVALLFQWLSRLRCVRL